VRIKVERRRLEKKSLCKREFSRWLEEDNSKKRSLLLAPTRDGAELNPEQRVEGKEEERKRSLF